MRCCWIWLVALLLMPLAVIIYMAVLVFTALWFAHFGLACLQDLRVAASAPASLVPSSPTVPVPASDAVSS